jgi:hypothetical protein
MSTTRVSDTLLDQINVNDLQNVMDWLMDLEMVVGTGEHATDDLIDLKPVNFGEYAEMFQLLKRTQWVIKDAIR